MTVGFMVGEIIAPEPWEWGPFLSSTDLNPSPFRGTSVEFHYLMLIVDVFDFPMVGKEPPD